MNQTAGHKQRATILVVDDTAANLQFLTRFLREHGYSVHPASDGALALESAQAVLPDLILLDIRMPGMDGFTVCRQLKADARTREVPVIFISILEDERDKVQGFKAGAVDYITKPFQPDEVLARIATHLRLRELSERLEQQVNERTKALKRLNRELRAISDCNQALMKAEDEQTLLNEVCRIICDEAGYRMAWVGYAEHDEAKTLRPVAWAGTEDGYLLTASITWADTERGRGPGGTSIRTGRSACIQDFSNDPNAAPWRENALKRGYRSCICLPLHNEKGEPFGMLAIYSTEPNVFTPDEVRLMEELSGDLVFGITVLRSRMARMAAEEEVRQNLTRQKALLDVCQKMATAPVPEIIAFVADRCVKLTGSAIGFVGLVSDDGTCMEAHAWSGKAMENCPIDKPLRFPLSEAGLWAEPIRQGRVVMVNDYLAPNPLKKGYPKGHLELTRFMGLPVADGDRVVAVAGVANRSEAYAEADQYHVSLLLQGMWDLIKRRQAEEALCALNSELEQRVRERTAELEAKNEELERLNSLFVGRELRMVELKEKIRELVQAAGVTHHAGERDTCEVDGNPDA